MPDDIQEATFFDDFVSRVLRSQPMYCSLACFPFQETRDLRLLARAHLSCRSRVSLESRYGMWRDRPSTSALITFPRADRDKLILFASFSLGARRITDPSTIGRKRGETQGGRARAAGADARVWRGVHVQPRTLRAHACAYPCLPCSGPQQRNPTIRWLSFSGGAHARTCPLSPPSCSDARNPRGPPG